MVETGNTGYLKPSGSPTARLWRPVWITALLLIAAMALFMTWGKGGNDWSFLLNFRGKKLLALILAAYAVGVSSLLFQTLTHNPILTPSILGFDAMYVFIQTLLVAMLGGLAFVQLPVVGKFAVEVLLMVGASILLFRLLLKQGGRDLARMILIGVIFGVFFRSITSLVQRLLDPEEFAVVQANSFAQFSAVNGQVLAASAAICVVSAVFLWRERYRLDVYLLGRDRAISLGIPYVQTTIRVLVWMAILVASATAMVGPVSFFGLLVCAMCGYFCPSGQHAVKLPLVFLLAALMLVGGQAMFEHILGMRGVLGAVIEFFGGLSFLYLILKKKTT